MGLLSRILEDEKLAFENPPLPHLKVGEGVLFSIPEYLHQQGFSRVALITGGYREHFEEQLRAAGIEAPHFPVSGEPSPIKVDQIRDTAAELQVDAVVAVGLQSIPRRQWYLPEVTTEAWNTIAVLWWMSSTVGWKISPYPCSPITGLLLQSCGILPIVVR
jgi:hypothetical protein